MRNTPFGPGESGGKEVVTERKEICHNRIGRVGGHLLQKPFEAEGVCGSERNQRVKTDEKRIITDLIRMWKIK